ncbi:MAG: LysM peptidoglycan-binding domain-containing protein [Bacilli bacterium]
MYKIYIVDRGDTIESIAIKFDTTIDVLKKINVDLSNLRQGMEIIVPNNQNIPFLIYTVIKGDTLFDIARRNNTNYKDLVLINGLEEGGYIYPGQELLIPKPGIGIYSVLDGETLTQVAINLKTTPESLISENAAIYLLPNQLIYKKEKKV